MIRQGALLILLIAVLFGAGSASAQANSDVAAGPEAGERRVALVIGNGNYASVGPLLNPIADAGIVADALRKVAFDSVTVASDLDRGGFERALRAFRAQAAGAKVAMIYYAGHGVEDGGHNWLIPVDATLQSNFDLAYEAIDLDRVMEAVAGAKVRLVVLDACRNTPFARRWPRATRGMVRGLGEIAVDDYLVIFAAAPGQTANDGMRINSPFAVSLSRRLQQIDLPVQLLGNAVRDDVLAATGGEQRPFVSSSISAMLVYLAPQPRLAPAARPGEPRLFLDVAALDALAWKGALRANTREAFEEYSTQFPNGRFVRIAEQNVRRLSSAIPRIEPVAVPPSRPQPLVQTVSFSALPTLPRSGVDPPPATVNATPVVPAESSAVSALNQGIQAHNDAIAEQNRAAQEKYRLQVAAVEDKVRLQREAYQRELDRFAGEEAKWRARVRACETGSAKECGQSATAEPVPPKRALAGRADEVIAWPEGIVVCQLSTDTSERESRCYGPARESSGPIGTREGDRAVERACDARQGIRDLGAIGGFRVYGCGFGVHPDPKPGIDRADYDSSVRFGLKDIPGRGTFHCTRATQGMCRSL
ncbi:caspase family protein [Sphingomonas profundi]|uniref:caspase family protein n=1 Tax=Alterirhizorhabdus profundi TaxID=2681549 RepID=UPI0012E91CE3|nr:caspase family protein [Sphingomonas profundi]